jgi:spore maturation protein CgeB
MIMRVAMFYHSLLSDWNHGNAHFLRGVASELISRGCEVNVYEPHDGWSLENLRREHGEQPVHEFHRAYPALSSRTYSLDTVDLDRELDGVDLVLVHEWNTHELVRRIGEVRARSQSFRLLFHDTHHRSVTDPESMKAYDLQHYDGVLAFGEEIRSIYLRRGWTQNAWTWHEAADVRVFHPVPGYALQGDVVWIGNWGDDERTSELTEFLIEPLKRGRFVSRVHGVRYPEPAIELLNSAGIEYAGWIANYKVPAVFGNFSATVHIPRRPYASALPGIPTIRPFEAMACGIPLVSAPWMDTEGLFRPGTDYLVANDGREMEAHLRAIVNDPAMASELVGKGLETILGRHTCAHRVDELMEIHEQLAPASREIVTTGIA